MMHSGHMDLLRICLVLIKVLNKFQLEREKSGGSTRTRFLTTISEWKHAPVSSEDVSTPACNLLTSVP